MTSDTIERASAHNHTRCIFRRPFVAACVLSFWGLCGLLPVSWASALGGFTMNIVGRFISRRHKVRANLEIAFPNLSLRQRDRLACDIRRNIGRTWAELP